MEEGIKAVADFTEMTLGLRAPQISEALGVPVKTLERRLRHLLPPLFAKEGSFLPFEREGRRDF